MQSTTLAKRITRRIAGIALFTLSVGTATAMAQTAPPADLLRKNGCIACHGLVHKQVGPGFAQIADRYRNDAGAAPRMAEKIRNGSVGSWGRVIMPRQSLVSEADSKVLATWVLSQPPVASVGTRK
ncbi:cytochrome c [Variovorax boronicumulans]